MRPEAYAEMAAVEDTHWWFCARRKILYYLIKDLPLLDNARILEIGCGTGGNLLFLSQFGHLSAMEMDQSARCRAIAKTGMDVVEGELPDNIPFPDHAFECICLFDVLEHIEQDFRALVEIKRLLAKGGKVVITVPAYQWLWSTHDEELHHVRRYTASELKERAITAGFVVRRISYFNFFLFPALALLRMLDKLTNRGKASGTGVPKAPINTLLGWVFGLEARILPWASFPCGTSILAVLESA